MRARSRRVTTALLVSLGLSLAYGASSEAHSTSVNVLYGYGLEALRLGTHQATAIATLERLLGRPTTRVTATPELKNCGVDTYGSWHSMSAFFDHGHLVGLAFGPGRTPSVRSDHGLRLGDTLARARAIYGSRLTTSGNNGGSWYVQTPVGRIDGFLSPSAKNSARPSSKIMTMDVGVVGCPAMSP